MQSINQIYVNGAFKNPIGSEQVSLINPSTGDHLTTVTLANGDDARSAVSAAKAAQVTFSRTNKVDRINLLKRLHFAVLSCGDALTQATIQEYGAPIARAQWVSKYAAQSFLDAAHVLENYEIERRMGRALVIMEPVGVSVLITPWNSNAGTICSKLAMAIAAGCAVVIKPSEFSAMQTHVLVEAFHQAGVPNGVVNVILGRGDVVGEELCRNPDVSRISFTGSTKTGKAIAREAQETMKRITLSLGGKSPTIILDDADFSIAIPAALGVAFQNNGQACIAGSRLLVPESRYEEAIEVLVSAATNLKVGSPADPTTGIGPVANSMQFERIQKLIEIGISEGATPIVGGVGRPEGFSEGFYIRPTIFINVKNWMTISREEIFGPVLCVLTYRDEDDAIEIANDSDYGLHAYVFTSDLSRAYTVARRLQSGRVSINGMWHDSLAPFGGYKQSGVGREFGQFGLESYLESKTVMIE